MPLDNTSTPSHSFLHSYCLYPKMHFESQVPGEQVILMLRAHPVTQIPWIFSTLVFLLTPLLGNIIIAQFFSPLQLIFLNLLWYSFVFSYAFFNLLVWLFNVGIITDRRVVDFDFHIILYKETSGTAFDDVADVTVKMGGFFASFFNYGNIYVQSSGIEQNIEFLKVPRPTEVVAIINHLSGRH